MSVLRAAAPLLALLVATAAAGPKSCPVDAPLSCHNAGPVEDTCCVVTSGMLLQTQFWDTNPPIGPNDSWTIHGLWPDNCDGTYPKTCDPSRAYNNITGILRDNGAQDTLDFMNAYWRNNRDQGEEFWDHEWAKHGTCVSTLSPHCYDDYHSGEEAVDYFKRVVELFQARPTYDWLAEAGIVPDARKSYATADIEAALARKHGQPVGLSCRGKTLQEVRYYFNVQGTLQTGQFVATHPDHSRSNCPRKVWYDPKQAAGDDSKGL